MTKTKFILLLLSVVLMAGSAMAVIFPDASFEDDASIAGTWEYLDVMATPWSRTIYGGNPWIGNNYANSNGYPQVGHDGDSYVGMNYSYIHQALGATYTDGETYELSAWATTYNTDQRLFGYFTVGGDGDGWTNAAVLDTETLAVTQSGDNTWYQLTYSYTAGLADDGQEIGIVFFGDYDVWVDNVTLVPEPMTIGLLGLGAAMLRRRKR